MRRNGVAMMVGFTIAVWVTAFLGFHGAAVMLAFGVLLLGTLIALRSLERERACWVCGQRYEVGVFGCHDACARETRLVR